MRSIDDLAISFDRTLNSNNPYAYASINTHYLKMLLEEVYDKSLNEILAAHTLTEGKMKKRVSMLTDVHHQEIGFMDINATLEDFGKFGMFILDEFHRPNLLSVEWMNTILNSTEESLLPPYIDKQWGHSNQWWLPMGDEGDFSAIGI